MTSPYRLIRTVAHTTQLRKILDSRAFRTSKGRKTVPGEMLELLADYSLKNRDVDVALLRKEHFSNRDETFVSVNIGRVKKGLVTYYEAHAANDTLLIYMDGRDLTLYVADRVAPAAMREAAAWKQAKVSMRTFARFLTEQCDADGMSEADRNQKLKAWVGARERLRDRIPFSTAPFKEFFAYFDAARPDRQKVAPLTFDEMVQLARSLGIHRIMLDPLRSSVSSAEGLVLSFASETDAGPSSTPGAGAACVRGEFWPVGPDESNATTQSGDRPYGHGASYSIPNVRLDGTDAAFVRLQLEPGGYSTQHHHAGDELCVALKGTVDVALVDSGVTFTLHPGDYAHFYAEQTHAVANASKEPAEVFIIRFYQADKANSRQQLRRELWRLARREGQPGALALGWMLAAAADRSAPPATSSHGARIPDEVLNRLGLAQLLGRLPLAGSRREKYLKKWGRARGNPASAEWHDALQRNLARVTRKQLVEVAELYEIFGFLAFEFLFPGVPRQIVVARRRDDRLGGGSNGDWVDMRDIEASLPGAVPQAVEGVKYEVPIRCLACSDILITRVTLQPGMTTLDNSHPGCELLLPLAGSAVVEYVDGPNEKLCQVTAPGELAHYNSDRMHRVCNKGDEPTELFVIRFFGESRPPRPRRSTRRRGVDSAPQTVKDHRRVRGPL